MTLSGEARQHLDQYLQDMRASLRDSDREGIAEIEQDIRDHIDAELGERPSPVSAEELDAVLGRLGSPGQWAAEAAPASRGTSVEEWFGYAAMALLLAGFVVPPLIVVSWLIDRAALARLEQRGEAAGARRWLFYPPLVVFSIGIALLLLFWPIGAFTELGSIAAQKIGAVPGDHFPSLPALAVALGSLGGYWIVLGAVLTFSERIVHFLFHPFADAFRGRHGWRLSGAGAVLVLCALAAFLGSR